MWLYLVPLGVLILLIFAYIAAGLLIEHGEYLEWERLRGEGCVTAKVALTVHTVDDDGVGGGVQTHAIKVGEEVRVAHPLETNIAVLVVDRIEED